MTTLVTGATGFIGGRLVSAFRERGDEVRALVRDPARAQNLAVRAVAAHLGPRNHNFESEVPLYLLAHALQRLSEELLNTAASQTDDMRVLLLQASLIVVLVAFVVHEIQLIHQAALLQQLERPVYGNAVELGVLLLGELKQPLGVEMLPGLVQQVE